MRAILVIGILLFCHVFTIAQHNNVKADYLDPSLSTSFRVLDLLSKLTVEEKISLLTASAPGIPRLNIEKYYHGNEALHGVVRPGNFTVFPQAIALASMWNPDLHYKIATAISDEARARWNELDQGKKQLQRFNDLLTFWSPTINMARDPRWGRTSETYGEDPFLAGTLAVQFIKGLQGNHPTYLKVVATPKHFAAYNQEANRASSNANVSMRLMREYYLPAFEASIKQGQAASIMSSYNSINKIPASANEWLLSTLLKKEWGFAGYVVCDCGAINNLVEAHKYVKTKELAAAAAMKAGLDLECGDDVYMAPLLNAYNQGLVSMSEIDSAAFRVLNIRMRLGLFDDPLNNPYNKIDPSIIGSKKHISLALQAARESIVLLKNENHILPIDLNKIKSVAVVGMNASSIEFGDYSATPMGEPVSIIQGIRDRVGEKVKINFAAWEPINGLEGYELISKDFLPGGLQADYYSNINLEGKFKSRKEDQINFDPTNQPPDAFIPTTPLSVKWEGNLQPTLTGKYSIGFLEHDGLRFYIDDKLVVDSWKRKSLMAKYVDVDLNANQLYHIKVEYFNYRNEPTAKLYWKAPAQTKSYKDVFSSSLNAAKKSELTIAVLGVNKNFEREGQDGESIRLSKDQEVFIQEIYKANPKTVVVLIAGGSLSIPWINKNIPGIVDAWYAGQQGGNAIADVLFGNYNPSGKLTLTFYNDLNEIPPIIDFDITKGRTYQYFKGKPLYPFGFGLSYTTFKYHDLKLSKQTGAIKVGFNIQNTGSKQGAEIAQVYVQFPKLNIVMPIKQLKGFKKVEMAKGATKHIEIVIDKSQLRYWNESKNAFVTPSGEYHILVGASSADIRLKGSFIW